mgnify:CR=1 FL=1
MPDFLSVSMQNFLYSRKSELRAQIRQSFRKAFKQRGESRCFFLCYASEGNADAGSLCVSKMNLQERIFKNESDTQISEQWI